MSHAAISGGTLLRAIWGSVVKKNHAPSMMVTSHPRLACATVASQATVLFIFRDNALPADAKP